jgi:hypothetical protein
MTVVMNCVEMGKRKINETTVDRNHSRIYGAELRNNIPYPSYVSALSVVDVTDKKLHGTFHFNTSYPLSTLRSPERDGSVH